MCLGKCLVICVYVVCIAMYQCQAETECKTPHTSVMQVSVFGRRNETGHLTSEVDISTNELIGTSSSEIQEDPWTVNVVHTASSCKGEPSVPHIKLIFSQDRFTPTGKLNLEPLSQARGLSRKINPEYEYFPGLGYYKFHIQPETWDHAREICQGEGADLIIVNSKRESELVQQILTRHPTIPEATHNDWIWVGAYEQIGLPRQFLTYKGDSLNTTGFLIWDNGQPHEGVKGIGGYIMIYRHNGFLGVTYHEDKEAYLCEHL